MPANLKNFTTTIPAERSIGEIQSILVQFGADSILTDIDRATRRVIGLSFIFRLGDTPVSFRLQPVAEENGI